ncbi:MAG: DUF6588 family protein [Bacteroidota bacterium]
MKAWQQVVSGALLVLAIAPGSLRAQSELETTLEQFSGDAVKGYIQPIADFFGANMNAGFYHTAAIPNSGFHLSVDIIGMGSMVGDDNKTYDRALPSGFSASSFKAPTIFGDKDGAVYVDPNTNASYGSSGGIINTSIFPLAVPQLTVGNFYGTVATVRFIATPALSDDKFPSTTLFGIGARHSISQYLPEPPLDISAGIMYSSFTVGDILDFKGLSIGAQASKSFSVLTLYGGLAWEQSTLGLSYTSTSVSSTPLVDIELDGENNFRFTMGAGLTLGFFNLFADANFGSVTNFSGGIGFGF